MSERDEIATILADRWMQMPEPTGGIDDRRPQVPLDLIRPREAPFEGRIQARSWEEIMDPSTNGGYFGAMVHPGPMPSDMGADIARYAANEAKVSAGPPRLEFTGPRSSYDPFRNALTNKAMLDNWGRSLQGGGRGHLDYPRPREQEPNKSPPYGKVKLDRPKIPEPTDIEEILSKLDMR